MMAGDITWWSLLQDPVDMNSTCYNTVQCTIQRDKLCYKLQNKKHNWIGDKDAWCFLAAKFNKFAYYVSKVAIVSFTWQGNDKYL